MLPASATTSRHGHQGVSGTVSSNDGSTLVVTTDDGDVTVTTGDHTSVSVTTDASFADLTVGDAVQVRGDRADDGTVTASAVHIGSFGGWLGGESHERTGPVVQSSNPDPSAATPATPATTADPTVAPATPATPATPAAHSQSDDDGSDEPAAAHVAGVVASNDGSTLTVTTADGSTVTVLTDAGTDVRDCDGSDAVPTVAGIAVGDRVRVEGTQNADGTVLASQISVGGDGDHDGTHDDHDGQAGPPAGTQPGSGQPGDQDGYPGDGDHQQQGGGDQPGGGAGFGGGSYGGAGGGRGR